jgi:hypothetical protein
MKNVKRISAILIAMAVAGTVAMTAAAEEAHECANCDTEYQCIVAISEEIEAISGEVEETANNCDENCDETCEECEGVDRSGLARVSEEECDEDCDDDDCEDCGVAESESATTTTAATTTAATTTAGGTGSANPKTGVTMGFGAVIVAAAAVIVAKKRK